MSNGPTAASTMRELIGAEVLVVDQDAKVQKGMVQLLSPASLYVTCVGDPDRALELMGKKFFSVVVADLDTPLPGAGLQTVERAKQISPTSMVIVLTPRKSFDDAVAAIRVGAIDIIVKTPESVAHLKERVMDAAGRSVGEREVNSLLGEVKNAHDDFLQLFMAAERRALDLSDRLAGRDPNVVPHGAELRVLVVDADHAETLASALRAGAPSGYAFDSAVSGGQGLDMAGSKSFHYVMVSDNLADLPSSMVVRSIKTQSPESVVMAFSGPGPGGKVEIVETARVVPVVSQFTEPDQLLARLDELAQAFRAKQRERRYTQAFRERHYDFLRRYVELKSKIDRALAES